MAAQLIHAAGESASKWTADRSALSIGSDLLQPDRPEDAPITKDEVREALDPLTGWCGNSEFWTRLPDTTFAVCLSVAGEPELLELEARLREAGIDHTAIREPDAPWNGALMSIGIVPMDRKPLRKLLGGLPLLR